MFCALLRHAMKVNSFDFSAYHRYFFFCIPSIGIILRSINHNILEILINKNRIINKVLPKPKVTLWCSGWTYMKNNIFFQKVKLRTSLTEFWMFLSSFIQAENAFRFGLCRTIILGSGLPREYSNLYHVCCTGTLTF